MAFPETIVTFPTKQNVTAEDGALIAQYQAAIEAQDLELASAILVQITNYANKIINAAYLNEIAQTVTALELFYEQRYNPAIVVSATQPAAQQATDFWFEITGTSA